MFQSLWRSPVRSRASGDQMTKGVLRVGISVSACTAAASARTIASQRFPIPSCAPRTSAACGYLTKGGLLLLSLVLIALLIAPGALAQESNAGFQGIVKDPTGAGVPNAALEVVGAALLGTRKVQSDDGGAYRFAALPPGEYTLTVTARGFRTFKQTGIGLTVGSFPNIDVRL